MRFVCLDFETNGFFDEAVYVLPWTSYPIQVSLTAVENGVVTPLYDSLIRGARSFATWVNENVPIDISDLDDAPTLRNVIAELASKLKPDDFIVAHNARFDMEQCLRRTAEFEGIKSPELDSIMNLPRFCTQNCEYVKSVLSKGERRLEHLCKHFGVEFSPSSAHDATYDTLKLAECVAEALYRGVMLPNEAQSVRILPPTERRLQRLRFKKPGRTIENNFSEGLESKAQIIDRDERKEE